MSQIQFAQQFRAYDKWKARLILTIEEFLPWLEKHGMSSPDSEARIQRTLDALRNDRLTLAFVAEFSRGKTELINALFFADYGRRVLPSTAGRTTMCPTEIFYDHAADEPYIRLLPIETRNREEPISELKNDPQLWVHYPLQVDSAQQLEQALKRVVENKKVTTKEAQRLGLYEDSSYFPHLSTGSDLEIPKWRHALVSFPHPLLKQGLTILDTPGLNALGSEPELTLNLLPAAQAVLFVLTADAGVTRSDLEVWREHIRNTRGQRNTGLIVALNKIDVLWDELLEESSVEQAIQKQRINTAEILGISCDCIFPVSAQKGLLAKIREDGALLKKSALLGLETYLSRDIINNKQQIIQEMVRADIGYMLENTWRVINNKSINQKKHMEELKQLGGKGKETIAYMIQQTRDEHTAYMHDLNAFDASRTEFGIQAQILREVLDMDGVNHVIKACLKEMSSRWTTRGLKKSMKKLFDTLEMDFESVVQHSEQTHKLISGIYTKFQNEHDFTVFSPPMLSVAKYQEALALLSQEADSFRNSSFTAMREQNTVIMRFFRVLVTRAQKVFMQTHQEANAWLDSALDPLSLQIRDHKEMLEDKLQNLKQLGRSKKTLETRVQELGQAHELSTQQLTMLQTMNNTLHSVFVPNEDKQPSPTQQRAAG